ncbi:hypothetical protein ACIBEJ_10215 [Nonomuraea sp. NPDC050790]|uniref:hypothetical protein n=1 Tax=Nonomuraea sp. NPDC050790 TaxID=3364371 RepID=UPI00379FAB6C
MLNHELGEDRPVEHLPDTRASSPVQLPWVVEQGQRLREDLTAHVQLHIELRQFTPDALAILADGGQLGPDLVFGHLPIGCQIKQVVFPPVQLPEPR